MGAGWQQGDCVGRDACCDLVFRAVGTCPQPAAGCSGAAWQGKWHDTCAVLTCRTLQGKDLAQARLFLQAIASTFLSSYPICIETTEHMRRAVEQGETGPPSLQPRCLCVLQRHTAGYLPWMAACSCAALWHLWSKSRAGSIGCSKQGPQNTPAG